MQQAQHDFLRVSEARKARWVVVRICGVTAGGEG
jgi:hypothetical protein